MLRSDSYFCCVFAGLLALFTSACSYTFDAEAQDIPLVGEPLNPAALLRFPGLTLGRTMPPENRKVPATRAELVRGQDKAPWLMWTTASSELHLQRLQDPQVEQVFSATQSSFDRSTSEVTLVAAAAMMPAQVSFVPVGKPPITVALPVEDTQFLVDDNLVLSWNGAAAPFAMHVLLRNPDSSLERLSIPWIGAPPDVTTLYEDRRLLFYYTWEGRQGFIDMGSGTLFDHIRAWFFRGNQVVYISKQGELRVYSYALHQDDSLGVSFVDGDDFVMSRSYLKIVQCNARGVNIVLLTDPGPTAVIKTLTSQACDRLVGLEFESVFFEHGANRYSLSLDGTTPPQLVLPPQQNQEPPREPPETPPETSPEAPVIATCGAHVEVTASRHFDSDPDAWGTSDGWIEDWQFMQRGLGVTFSNDCDRVRWKEYAARPDHMGELLSATIPRGEVLRLARNVLFYDLLPDGRVISTANMTVPGPQNRIVLIDETRRESRLLLEEKLWPILMSPLSWEFPGNSDVLIESIGDGGVPELLLVPLPPRQL
jgi:hypothetical protein